jgi:hypothetical protein
MGVQLFEKFAEMIDKLPAKAVLSAAQLERQMLENDIEQKRALPMVDVHSITAFCSFLENASDAIRAPRVSVPVQHLGFYRDTITRLVKGGELPCEAGALFDRAFTPVMLNAA